MFYNEYVRLCISANTTPTGAAKAMGLAGAHVNKWKNGSIPTDTTLVKVARHFGLPDNYFDNFKKAKEKSPTPEGVGLSLSDMKKMLQDMDLKDLTEMMAECASVIQEKTSK